MSPQGPRALLLRPVIVLSLAAAAFLGLYAAGQASESGSEAERPDGPTTIQGGGSRPAERPPRLSQTGALPSLKPARRRDSSAAPEGDEEAATDVESGSVTPDTVAPAPAPAPAPVPAPAPQPAPAPAPAPGDGGGKPFYDDG